MAKRRRVWNRAKYEEYLRAGRGQGVGAAYLPWITVQSFSSSGTVSRVYGYKAQRVHHFLSRNELYYFYLLEWSDRVLDIREQFPLLDVELATNIASGAGIKYPRDNVSGFPYILTCDFMITTHNGLQARTIKSSKDLGNRRTLEKLEIERRYWKECNVEWCIVTENEIPIEKARHIEWIHTANELPAFLADPEFREEMLNQLTLQPLPHASKLFDERHGFPIGSGLQIVKHLLWTKQILLVESDPAPMEVCI